MDFSKLMAVISAFVLIVCLVLSITTLVVLRNAVAENGLIQEDAKSLIGELNTSVDRLESTTNSQLENTTDEELPVNADTERFTIREYEGKIAIFTEDGRMLHWLDVDLSLLPKNEREALAEGIEVKSRASLLSYLQDYTS